MAQRFFDERDSLHTRGLGEKNLRGRFFAGI
jgi:hypothetical protein